MDAPFPPGASAVVTPDQLSTQLGHEVVILGLRDSVYYGLADVGARIWELLQTRRTINEIVRILVTEYDVTPDKAEGDLQTLLRDLHERGLIAITPPDLA
jgi:hypothetical protein